jgi:XTP/dITP diphosphohydrolase
VHADRKAEPPLLLIGTTSAGKLREYRHLFAGLPGRLVAPADLGLDLDVAEGDRSFAHNARLKARAYWRASGLLTLAEDSGFVVDALNGEPGVRSARWGDTDDYAIKNRLILERLEGVPWEQRGCRYVSYLAIVEPGGRLHRRSDSCSGYVAREPRGSGGFGYDPIFFVPRFGRTMAELTAEEKAGISHRGRAARRALPLLSSLLSEACRRRRDSGP